ncbi:N-acetylneuraminate synthase [uncultured Amphritea sp.]|uniref:N-acetylneuraminate synthase n=1 Tax=uncultured Amphritea sp. TaxID=981605 RepID=UPI00261D16D8|nr:N-acetylneuraminate synthase [uncultured Amphritea sp.]
MSCFIIAEAGVNHNGSEDLAFKLIDIAVNAGADAIKFQTFKADRLVLRGTSTAEYQQRHTGSSDQFQMLKQLELSDSLHFKLRDRCQDRGIEFMSTPFDLDAAEMLINLGMKRLKIPSGELTNLPLIKQLVRYNCPIILSTGMSSLNEVEDAVNCIDAERQKLGYSQPLSQVLTLLHCTSNYPTKPEDVNLQAMVSLKNTFSLPVGYSDHTEGCLISTAAVAMGAVVIEKHFTLDKTLPGPDHKASLDPQELELMIAQIRKLELSFGDGVKRVRDSELPVRDLVRRSIVLASDKKVGDVLADSDFQLLRPGSGIAPKYLETIIGKSLIKEVKRGHMLCWSDIDI